MRRPVELRTLYELVCERYPQLPHTVKGKLANAAQKLLGADLCDVKAQVEAIHLAIEEHIREESA